MKRIWVAVTMLSLCLCTHGFADGLFPAGCSGSSFLAKDLKINPYAQVGFQWLASNLNLPVQNEPFVAIPLQIGDLDIALRDANFWTGIVGFNIVASEKYSLFGAAGGILGRPFLTTGNVPVNVTGVGGASPVLEFTNSRTESWFVQTGIGLGPILAGLYWDHFSFGLGDPRTQNGPITNQTIRGDILTRTFAPFIGVAVPAGGANFTITYSPLAYSNTQLSLTGSQDTVTQLRYTWNKPGDLINATLQYNTPVSSSTTFGLWANGSWMWMRRSAGLEFENNPPTISRNREVTATMTKYGVGGGVMLGVNF